jgi:RecB family exonuclease
MTAKPNPRGLSTSRLTKVWASRYGSLRRCVLREAANAGGQLPLMPQQPRAALGTVIHKLFERAASDPSFDFSDENLAKQWNEEIAAIEHFFSSSYYMEGLLPLARSIPNIGLMRARTFLRLKENIGVREVPEYKTSSGKSKPPRGRLSNESETVVGIPDKISRSPSGVVIADYKTGVTSDSKGLFWSDYELQLKLYASLYHASVGVWPSGLELRGLDGAVYQTEFSPDDCTKLLSDAETLASLISKDTDDLHGKPERQKAVASPSQENCGFCTFRPNCPAYLLLALENKTPCKNDVYGLLKSATLFGNGEYLVELDSPAGTLRVRNLPPITHLKSALESSIPGQKIIVFNVVKTEEANPLFSPTAYTALHVYAEEKK